LKKNKKQQKALYYHLKIFIMSVKAVKTKNKKPA